MALLVLAAAPAGAGVVAPDLLALATHRLDLVAAALGLLGRATGERRLRLARVVEAQVAGKGPCPCKGELRLTGSHRCAATPGASGTRWRLSGSSLRAAAPLVVCGHRHRLIEVDPAQDLVVDAVQQRLEHVEGFLLVFDERIALAVAAQ